MLTPRPGFQTANATIAQPSCGNGKAAAEQWKAFLENEIGSLSEFIRYAGGKLRFQLRTVEGTPETKAESG